MRAFVYGPAAAAALLLSCSQNQAESGQPEFSGERIKADISYLADDMLEGRGTGTKGYEIAARFLASRFMGLGLQPGNNGNWFQSVPFTETRLKPGAPSYVAIDGVQFANGVDSLVYPSPLYPDQKITGDAVFVGYGLDSRPTVSTITPGSTSAGRSSSRYGASRRAVRAKWPPTSIPTRDGWHRNGARSE